MAEAWSGIVPNQQYGQKPVGIPAHFAVSTAQMYDTRVVSEQLSRRTHGDASGLPDCVRLINTVVTAEQKQKDSQLPKLLFDLDEAIKNDANDVEKGRISFAVLHAASSPLRKYRLLQFFDLLDKNKHAPNIELLPGALVILEKYATNLLKKPKPALWRVVKFNLSIIQKQVFPVHGAVHVLQQMGYTAVRENALVFPDNVHSPDIDTVVILAADLVIARAEIDALLTNRHLFLSFQPPAVSNTNPATSGQAISAGKTERDTGTAFHPDATGGFCGVCSQPNLAKSCKDCDMQFCQECDERWHSHVQRRSHFRHNLLNPALQEADKEKPARPRPVPRPRQRKSQPDQSKANVTQSSNEVPSSGTAVRSPVTGTNEPVVTTAGKYPTAVSSSLGLSPDIQDIRRPPSWTSGDSTSAVGSTPLNTGLSPVQVNPLRQPTSPSMKADPASLSTQLGFATPQRNQINANPFAGDTKTEVDRPQRSFFGLSLSAANGPVISCPKCLLLVSSSEPLCPSCKFPLEKHPAPLPGADASSEALISAGGYAPENIKPVTTAPSNVESLREFFEISPRQKDIALASRKLPDLPVEKSTPFIPAREEKNAEALYEDIEPYLKDEWSCEHCTFINPVTTRICQTCFKTPTNLRDHPSMKTQSPKAAPSLAGQRPPSHQEAQRMEVDQKEQSMMYEDMSQNSSREAVFMTPKDMPLEGGIYSTPTHPSPQPPPLPPRKGTPSKVSPPGKVINAQMSREQELSEKERAKRLYEEKLRLLDRGHITDEAFYNITEEDVYNIEAGIVRVKNVGSAPNVANALDPGRVRNDENIRRVPSPGVMLQEKESKARQSGGVSDEQLRQLLQARALSREDPYATSMRRYGSSLSAQAGDRNAVPRQDLGLSDEELQQLLQSGALSQEDSYGYVTRLGTTEAKEPRFDPKQDMRTSDAEVQKLLKERSLTQEDPYQKDVRRNVAGEQVGSGAGLTKDPKLALEERFQMLPAGVGLQGVPAPAPPAAQLPHLGNTQDDLQDMMNEFRMLEMTKSGPEAGADVVRAPIYDNVDPHKMAFSTLQDSQIFYAAQDVPAMSNIYDNVPPKSADSRLQDTFSKFLSSHTHLEDYSAEHFIEEQGRMYIQWVKQAEIDGFTPEELNLATNLCWQDPQGRNPVQWLRDEWTGLVADVIGRVTEQTGNENDRIGNLSTEEAKEALLKNHGSVESACKSCIESRREKLAKMGEVAVYGRAECLNALDNNDGDLEKALLELEQKALEPIRNRVLGLDHGTELAAVSGSGETDVEKSRKIKTVVTNKNVTFERRVRVLFAEKNMKSWGRAETAVKLIDMDFSVEDCIEAAEAYGDMERSLRYLQQECPVCLEEKPMGQMIIFLNCQDRICKECVAQHLNLFIREKNIHNIVCPVCGEPDLSDESVATEYFNNLDVLVREFVDSEVHNLFQRKLRDRSLQKEPNFRWCAHCSSGFINEAPNVNKMRCPHCRKYTCFNCKKQWEDQHEGISCEQFARWQEENDEEFQQAGLVGHLARNGIDCPECKFRYDLARGGCMHFKCGQCNHEFCSGCNNPFKHGGKCRVSPSCAQKGIHAHHPRDCLFYLRDWAPKRLQRLLDQYGVQYDTGGAGLPVQEEDDDEGAGAVAGAYGGLFCKVMEQKETPNGLQDAECGAPCADGHDELCKVHYTEYLVSLINKNGIDPAEVMDVDELTIVLRRAEFEPPDRERGEHEDLYRDRMLNILKARLPLKVQNVAQEEGQNYDEENVEVILA